MEQKSGLCLNTSLINIHELSTNCHCIRRQCCRFGQLLLPGVDRLLGCRCHRQIDSRAYSIIVRQSDRGTCLAVNFVTVVYWHYRANNTSIILLQNYCLITGFSIDLNFQDVMTSKLKNLDVSVQNLEVMQ